MAEEKQELKAKLLELYPELERYGLSIELEFDQKKNAWVITFEKGGRERHAFLDKKDADECIQGRTCIYLGVLIGQYIRDLENIPE